MSFGKAGQRISQKAPVRKPVVQVTPRQDNFAEFGIERLEAIRERMQESITAFARLLHIHKHTYHRMKSGEFRVRTSYVELAETKLKEFLRKEKAAERKAAAEVAKIEAAKPHTTFEIEPDPEMKVKVMRLYLRGRDKASIASDLALRPAVVDHYLKDIENISAD